MFRRKKGSNRRRKAVALWRSIMRVAHPTGEPHPGGAPLVARYDVVHVGVELRAGEGALSKHTRRWVESFGTGLTAKRKKQARRREGPPRYVADVASAVLSRKMPAVRRSSLRVRFRRNRDINAAITSSGPVRPVGQRRPHAGDLVVTGEIHQEVHSLIAVVPTKR